MKRFSKRPPVALEPGEREYEFGIPIAGVILPNDQWAKTALKKLPAEGQLDLSQLFGRVAPVALDIGCGNGRFTIESAFLRKEIDHLAIDLLPAVIRYGTRRANQRGLTNVRFAVSDGWRMLSKYLPDSGLDEIHIYHPQPFADQKHAWRRMLTPDFLILIHQKLNSKGRVFVQTDRLAYWEYIEASFKELFDWHTVETWDIEPWVRSRREIIARKQGLSIYRGVATRRDDWTAESLQTAASQMPMPTFDVVHGDD